MKKVQVKVLDEQELKELGYYNVFFESEDGYTDWVSEEEVEDTQKLYDNANVPYTITYHETDELH